MTERIYRWDTGATVCYSNTPHPAYDCVAYVPELQLLAAKAESAKLQVRIAGLLAYLEGVPSNPPRTHQPKRTLI